MSDILEKLCISLAWRLPKRLVYWCAIRVNAHATTGQYSNQIMGDLTIEDSMKRWDTA